MITPKDAYELSVERPSLFKKRKDYYESIIAKDGRYSHEYAIYVLNRRFKLGEPAIATNAEYSYYYVYYVLNGRFKLGEKAIAISPFFSYEYAMSVLKDRFELGEYSISMRNKFVLNSYICIISNIKDKTSFYYKFI